MKNTKNIDMELTIEGLGETLKLMNGFLMIGNECDNNKTLVCIEDISQVQNKELVSKLEELQKVISSSCMEIKELAVEAYHNDWTVEGVLDEVEEGVKGGSVKLTV